MVNLERLGKVIEIDVLVIGGGVSGIFAAVRARRFVDRVAVVDKGPIGSTSQCYFALGGHQAVLPGDDIDAWVKEVVYFSDGLVEQDIVEFIYRETFDRIKDFERFGVEFIKDEGGSYRRFTTRGLNCIRGLRPHPHGIGGRLEVHALVQEANRLGVLFLSRIFVTDLLKCNGTIGGAIGFNIRNGEFYIFKAGAVVLATGQCAFKGPPTGCDMAAGDGIDMALRAGAELQNLEFQSVRIEPTLFAWEAVGTALDAGAVLLNAKAEPFMERYSPILKSKIDFNYVARAMAIEAKEGRSPFYLDYGTIKPETLEFLRKRSGWMELHIKKLRQAGINPFDEKLEWVPGVAAGSGGVRSDVQMQTIVPGLFVAGRVRNIDPGVVMGSWGIGSGTVLGYRAGESAAQYSRSRGSFQIDQDEVETLKSDLYAPLGKVGIEPTNVLPEIQKTLFASGVLILKNGMSLKRALGHIESIRDELLPRMGARDVHYLMALREVRSMTLVAELMLRASLMRTESRAGHYREDYPSRDDEDWLKWIVISHEDKELSLRPEPVPFDRYKFKPSRYYMDNFKIPR